MMFLLLWLDFRMFLSLSKFFRLIFFHNFKVELDSSMAVVSKAVVADIIGDGDQKDLSDTKERNQQKGAGKQY